MDRFAWQELQAAAAQAMNASLEMSKQAGAALGSQIQQVNWTDVQKNAEHLVDLTATTTGQLTDATKSELAKIDWNEVPGARDLGGCARERSKMRPGVMWWAWARALVRVWEHRRIGASANIALRAHLADRRRDAQSAKHDGGTLCCRNAAKAQPSRQVPAATERPYVAW